jgi:hypothetical protein
MTLLLIFGDCEDGTCGYIQVENRSEFASKGDDVIQYRESQVIIKSK